MMKNHDESIEINHNPDWPYTPDHPYRILIIGLNWIKNQWPDIDKIYYFIKDPSESITYQWKRKSSS